jgi:HEAT repeat protein
MALEEIGHTRAVEPLYAALKDSDKDVRLQATRALVKFGDKRAVEPLCAALKDTDKGVRLWAAETLGKIGDKRAVEPLCAALKDTDKDVRRCAAEVLGKIGDKRAVEPLLAAFEDVDWEVWLAVLEALGNVGDARASHALIAALKKSPRAAQALVKIGSPAVEPLCVFLETTEPGGGTAGRLEAAEALIQLYKSGAIGESNKRMILAQRQRITGMKIHIDQEETIHHDTRMGDCWNDTTKHTDYGTALDFPL